MFPQAAARYRRLVSRVGRVVKRPAGIQCQRPVLRRRLQHSGHRVVFRIDIIREHVHRRRGCGSEARHVRCRQDAVRVPQLFQMTELFRSVFTLPKYLNRVARQGRRRRQFSTGIPIRVCPCSPTTLAMGMISSLIHHLLLK
jgi:hypothetical protein